MSKITLPNSGSPKPNVVAPKRTTRDSPLLSTDVLQMLNDTTSIARRTMGQSHAMAFPTTDRSPRCHPKDDDKFYLVSDGNLAGVPGDFNKIEFQVPWYMSKGFDSVSVDLILKSNFAWPFSIVMNMVTLVDSVTTSTTSASAASFPQAGSYHNLEGAPAPLESSDEYHVNTKIHGTPNLPASREFAMTFELQFLQQTSEVASYQFGGNYNLFASIQSLYVYDYPSSLEVA